MKSSGGLSPPIRQASGWRFWSAILASRGLCDPRQGAGRRQDGAASTSEDRVYTVISGDFYIGLGERFDGC
jgi:hypothetical protein